MKLYKYCKPEHNPLNGCRTLMLGSTKAFRKYYKGEDDLINDKQEGLATGIDRNNIRFYNAKNHPDAFVFCTSLEKSDSSYAQSNFDTAYTSLYCIKDADKFHQRLVLLASRQIFDKIDSILPQRALASIDEYKKKHNLNDSQYYQGLRLMAQHDKVSYNKDLLHQVTSYTDPLSLSIISHFTKPPSYQFQMEYRLVVVLWHRPSDIYYDITENGLLIQFDDIGDYITIE